jgi:hypothetical protein
MCVHSAGSRSCACSSGSGNNWHKRPGRPSGWPGLRYCCRSGCSCMCSCCISASRRRAAGGSHPSRAGCRRCCSGSSRCAIGSQLVNVSVASDDVDVVEHGGRAGARHAVSARNAYRVQRPFLPRGSGLLLATADTRCWPTTYLPAPLARIDDIVLVGWRLGVRSWRVHGASGHSVGVGVWRRRRRA